MLNDMAETETLFIRTYVRALHRDYDLLRIVFGVMSPDHLAVPDIVVATRVAVETEKLHARFEAQVEELGRKHQFFKKTPTTSWPAPAEIGALFMSSFFTVILKPVETAQGYKNAKWYSGDPKDWAAVFNKLDAADIDSFFAAFASDSPPASGETNLTKAAKKLFHQTGNPLFDFLAQFKIPPYFWLDLTDSAAEQFDYFADDEDYDEDYDEDDDYYADTDY